ncbi:hypothetical protein KM800_13160 [Clostridium tyrobutyricum]|uniref:phenylpyruvate tautomerase MIF-related protein n=1 Tax=Clostridium tyrobutyricum TaxID=1519 RepID=UPI001C388CD3|nr:phenylpyruvate tautomerase MIF-related protein [Clostridium tyrobutyricum]MBV4420255.1 hypothetical protein [Clostridium tyrobutyricum]
MPYIQTKVNVEITKDKEKNIKQKLGKAIELIPGKSEKWLMLSFQDNANLYFKGNNEESIAFIEVKIFGKADNKEYNSLTKEITNIFSQELNIKPSQIYIKYEEVEHWGWNGSNF